MESNQNIKKKGFETTTNTTQNDTKHAGWKSRLRIYLKTMYNIFQLMDIIFKFMKICYKLSYLYIQS